MKFYGFYNLPSRSSFQQRALYKEQALASIDRQLNVTDFWYKNPLYGKLDQQGRVVVPNESFLVPVYDNNGVYALDFVAEAYRDFKRSFLSHLADEAGIKSYNSYLVNFCVAKCDSATTTNFLATTSQLNFSSKSFRAPSPIFLASSLSSRNNLMLLIHAL